MVAHLQKKYPALTSHQLGKIEQPVALAFEQIHFFSEHPIKEGEIVALTKSSRMVRYKIVENKFVAVLAISVDVPAVRNFTFDESSDIIIPTADNKLLKIDPNTLELKASIDLYE